MRKCQKTQFQFLALCDVRKRFTGVESQTPENQCNLIVANLADHIPFKAYVRESLGSPDPIVTVSDDDTFAMSPCPGLNAIVFVPPPLT